MRVQVTYKDDAVVQMESDTSNQVAREIENRICLGCKERIPDGKRVIRGLHEKCYRAAHRMICSKQVSERALIKAGRILPTGGIGKAPTGAFARQLKEAGLLS